ncbi:conserved hypothetical protein [Bacteroidetes oral taxon 274 str. F0058]|jgi:hypothetical protein|nr:conserved hypothetical protein [Bacteroidetes oral taxon 274 str. F0058]
MKKLFVSLAVIATAMLFAPKAGATESVMLQQEAVVENFASVDQVSSVERNNKTVIVVVVKDKSGTTTIIVIVKK